MEIKINAILDKLIVNRNNINETLETIVKKIQGK